MSNVKEVRITGQLPFDMLYENPLGTRKPNERLLKFFAMFSAPAWGIHIRYGKEHLRDNDHGGQTTYYEFEIYGEEAVRDNYILNNVREMIRYGAELESVTITDLEWDDNPVPTEYSVKELHDDCRGLIVYGK